MNPLRHVGSKEIGVKPWWNQFGYQHNVKGNSLLKHIGKIVDLVTIKCCQNKGRKTDIRPKIRGIRKWWGDTTHLIENGVYSVDNKDSISGNGFRSFEVVRRRQLDDNISTCSNVDPLLKPYSDGTVLLL